MHDTHAQLPTCTPMHACVHTPTGSATLACRAPSWITLMSTWLKAGTTSPRIPFSLRFWVRNEQKGNLQEVKIAVIHSRRFQHTGRKRFPAEPPSVPAFVPTTASAAVHRQLPPHPAAGHLLLAMSASQSFRKSPHATTTLAILWLEGFPLTFKLLLPDLPSPHCPHSYQGQQSAINPVP